MKEKEGRYINVKGKDRKDRKEKNNRIKMYKRNMGKTRQLWGWYGREKKENTKRRIR